MVTRHPKLVIEIFYLDGPQIFICILFLTAIKLKCPPPVHEWGGGAIHIRESGGRTSIYCFYTIHFKILSTPPIADLKGALHEICYVHILPNIEAHGAVVSRSKYDDMIKRV